MQVPQVLASALQLTPPAQAEAAPQALAAQTCVCPMFEALVMHLVSPSLQTKATQASRLASQTGVAAAQVALDHAPVAQVLSVVAFVHSFAPFVQVPQVVALLQLALEAHAVAVFH